MKAGIVTFEKAINYGTSLQAVALLKVLQEQEIDAAFVHHYCEEIDKTSRVFDWKQARSPAYTLAHLYNLDVARKRKNQFKRFWNQHYVTGPDDPAHYDIVIAGSDQVWNYNLTARDWFFFLDFPKGKLKKVSYAGSFGLSQIDPALQPSICPLLEDFDYISVREQTAAGLVEEICGRKVPVVLDPTLLLNRQQWSELADLDFSHRGYIFVYTVFNSNSLWEFAYELSKKTGLPIRTISYSKIHRRKAEYTLDAGPAQWLSHILNAEYVVTNSFHGFAFSVNFEKQFYYELPPHSSGVGSRLSDMAQAYGLTGRELKHKDECAIDYAPVRDKLEKDREKSMDFIRSFLK